MKDPYDILGVAKTATDDQLKSAYRKLARAFHPDLHPGDKKAEDRFKDVSAAYDFLSDSERRRQYDNGEIDASGAPRRPSWSRASAGAGRSSRNSGFGSGFGGFGFGGESAFGENVDDILTEMMRRKEKGRQGGGAHAAERKGADAHHALSVTFEEAALGGTKRVTLVTGKALDIRIPAGATDGQTLRLKGQGHSGVAGGAAGDAFIDLKVMPHAFFTRQDRDVLLNLPISVPEAVMGAKVTVPTVDGKVSLTIPAGSNSGTVMRLKGKGVGEGDTRGDQLVTLMVALPERDEEFRRLVEKWGARNGYDPRAKAGLV